MPNVAQRNFAGGELAPALYARTDVIKYATGLRTLRNFIVQRHGGVANRPGTRYVAAVKDSTQPVRLIKFVFNASQTYVLEFGNGYLRFYQLGGQVVVAGVAAWSNVPAYVVGDLVVSGGVNYYCVQAHTNHVPPNAGFWYALTGAIYEIPSPYATADLPDLRLAQSADVVTLVHPSYPPQELRRLGNTRWTLGSVTFGPAITGPLGVNATGGTAVTPFRDYSVTAVDKNGEESLIASFVAIAAKPSDTVPIVVTWGAVAGAAYYNVYSAPDGVTQGLLGTTVGLSFSDINAPVDFTQTPPQPRPLFATPNGYPAAVGYTQQRRLFGNSNAEPEKTWTSRIGQPRNFTTSFPIQDDDAITFQLASTQVNAVQHLLELGRLLVFTSGGEHLIEGDQAGVLRPSAINARQIGYAGSGRLAPVKVIDTALYVQALGQVVRDLRKAIADFESSDLTVFAAHLVDGYTLVDWDYAQLPHSVVWAARSDGVLLGLTYLREQQIAGWHRHDTDGAIENVCVVPEGSEHAVYLVVRRTVNGATVRYVERLQSRSITALTDVRDLVFVDASLAYDGRNAGAETMVLSGGITWANGELLTLTRSVGGFVAGDAGNTTIQLTGTDGTEIRFAIASYTSGTVVQGFASQTVPVDLQGVATSVWAKAVRTIAGLNHLEGKAVSVFADGYVVASPKNAAYGAPLVVTGGVITLPAPYAVVQVGLPYISDLETLDIDTPAGRSLKESKMIVQKVGLMVERSRGIWAGQRVPEADPLNTTGDPLYNLDEAKIREAEAYTSPVQLLTGDVDVTIESNWDSTGRICVRQVDPVPLTILSARPQGLLPIA